MSDDALEYSLFEVGILDPTISDLEFQNSAVESLELRLEEQATLFEEEKLKIQANAEIDAERVSAARQLSIIEPLRIKIKTLELELKKQAEFITLEKARLKTEIETERRAKEASFTENIYAKTEIETLKKRLAQLELDLSKQTELFEREKIVSHATLSEEIQAKEAALSENAKLKASAQVAAREILRLESFRLKTEQLESQLKEQFDLLNQKNLKIQTESDAQKHMLSASQKSDSALESQLTESKRALALLENENTVLKRNLEDLQKTLKEPEGLKLHTASPFLELQETPLPEPPQPEAQPSPTSMELALEPHWLKALDAIKDPVASAQARIKQLASLRLPEGPRAILGLAVGSLAQASDTLKMIGEFLGETAPPGAPGHLESALDSSLSAWESAFRRKRISISRHIQTGLNQVLMNQDSLRTAIYQILRNAYEAMPKGGALKISVEDDATSAQIKAVFADTGPGFSVEALSQLFIPFASLRPGHLGLGLSLARRILRRYGGELEAANLTPKGAEITLRFALVDSTAIPSLTEVK